MSSPPGKIIKPDDCIVMKGEGMPVHKHPEQKGDLYIVFDVEMPDNEWLKSVDHKVFDARDVVWYLVNHTRQALEALLPPKKVDMDPLPAVVEDAVFEESDIVDVGSRSFPPSSDFFDHGFASQFGEGDEDDWVEEDEDDEDDEHGYGGEEPDCRPQ